MSILVLEPLTKQAFAPFGDVIEIAGSDWLPINNGTTRRYHKLGLLDSSTEGGQAGISMARGDAFTLPQTIHILERHPLGSQAFIPCNGTSAIIVVAPPTTSNAPEEGRMRAFLASGEQGVHYHRGTWHHPLMSLNQVGVFIMLDRIGGGHNCDEVSLSKSYQIVQA
ncbi:ureidoglycolate lyase [Neisseriaceae bacterium TC5R-5]|nr:ureidoglycolate lyase [Neisseriaceae bacterium TC5R-5]